MLAVFFVAFDRLVGRVRRTSWQYDWKTNHSWHEESLIAPSNKTHVDKLNRFHEYIGWQGQKHRYQLPDLLNRITNRQFSNKTRNYLRRRVWRYFRNLARRDANAYVSSLCLALSKYEDRDFQAGENILDNWSLMHACFYSDPSIRFTAAHTNLRPGGSIQNLKANPYLAAVWETEHAAEQLIHLIVSAKSTLARIWALEMFKENGKKMAEKIPFQTLTQLLKSSDSQIRLFAFELVKNHPETIRQSAEQWIDLLNEVPL